MAVGPPQQGQFFETCLIRQDGLRGEVSMEEATGERDADRRGRVMELGERIAVDRTDVPKSCLAGPLYLSLCDCEPLFLCPVVICPAI